MFKEKTGMQRVQSRLTLVLVLAASSLCGCHDRVHTYEMTLNIVEYSNGNAIELTFLDYPGQTLRIKSPELESYLLKRDSPRRVLAEFRESSALGCVYTPALVKVDGFEFDKSPTFQGSKADSAPSPWGWCY